VNIQSTVLLVEDLAHAQLPSGGPPKPRAAPLGARVRGCSLARIKVSFFLRIN